MSSSVPPSVGTTADDAISLVSGSGGSAEADGSEDYGGSAFLYEEDVDGEYEGNQEANSPQVEHEMVDVDFEEENEPQGYEDEGGTEEYDEEESGNYQGGQGSGLYHGDRDEQEALDEGHETENDGYGAEEMYAETENQGDVYREEEDGEGEGEDLQYSEGGEFELEEDYDEDQYG